jgi:hypothetical protein
MTDDRSLERAARSWLEAGPTEAPDRAVEAALLRIQTTPQERDLRIPWRLPKMTTRARVATAAVIGVLAVGGALFMLGRPGQTGVGGPGPTSTLTASPSPTAPPTPIVSPGPIGEGPLEAGQHMAKPFAPPNGNGVCEYVPQPGCSDTARDDTIRVTFTVPDGWASNDSGAAINKPATGWVAPQGMGLLFDRGGWLRSDPCIKVDTVSDIPVGPSVDDFANALADHPLIDATTPTSVSLGGYSGKYMDLQLPSDITDCTFAYYAWVPSMPAQGPSHRRHLWILDVEGIRVVVQTADFAGTTAEDLAELQAIVDSIQIEP